jgi:hypothetical protein
MRLFAVSMAAALLLPSALASGETPAAKDEPVVVTALPEYKNLLEWTAAVSRPQFELLRASKQRGFYFAVFRTPSGDVALCYRAIGETPDPKSSSLTIENLNGHVSKKGSGSERTAGSRANYGLPRRACPLFQQTATG